MSSNLYQDLDAARSEIRLSKLSPSADENTPIEIELIKASLLKEWEPEYYALSYVWGDPNVTVPITVNGRTRLVTNNLGMALRYLRKKEMSMVLWVDAICIDQTNLTERNFQVQIMGRIFASAKKVIAWLGESSNDSNVALSVIEQWAQWRYSKHEIFDYNDHGDAIGFAGLSEMAHPAFNEVAIQALENFGNRSLWTRSWIAQEIGLARDVLFVCGHQTVSRDTIFIASSAWELLCGSSLGSSLPVGNLFKTQNTSMYTMFRLLRDREASQEDRFKAALGWMLKDPEDIMERSRGLKATDPRDKVYAFRSLLCNDLAASIVPDYEKDLSDVLSEFAKSLIFRGKSLRCVSDAGQEALRTSGIPSWVPCWNDDPGHPEPSEDSARPPSDEDAGNTSSLISFTSNNRVLRVYGHIVDSIDIVYANVYPSMNLEGMRKFEERILSGPYLDGRSALNRFFRAVDWQVKSREFKNNGSDEDAVDYYNFLIVSIAEFITAIFLSMRTINQSATQGDPDDILSELVSAFYGNDESIHSANTKKIITQTINNSTIRGVVANGRISRYVNQGWVPFETKSGHIGLGPERICPGDVICDLAAHPFPFILHPEDGHYTVRGDCSFRDLCLPSLSREHMEDMLELEIH